MNNKSSWFQVIVLALVIVVSGWYFSGLSANKVGATYLTYTAAQNRLETYNLFSAIITDLTAVRAPLASIDTAQTASITFPSVSSSTISNGTSTTVTGLAAALGDIVLVSPVTSNPGLTFHAAVETASTTSATIIISATYASTTASTATITPVASVFNLTVLPRASFVAAAALTASTTSTPNNY